MAVNARAAVFLDKDGTVVEDVPYNVNPALVRLAAGAREALPGFAASAYLIIIVSNQSGIARGLIAPDQMGDLERHLRRLFESVGGRLDGFYCCPHHPEGLVPEFSFDCTCRKPECGLIRAAAADHDIELSRSWMVGDILDDVEAGRRAGCRTVLLTNGNETLWKWDADRQPTHCVFNLNAAAEVIIHEGGFSGC
jgi:histidinol-phosphate phosphatase family protein